MAEVRQVVDRRAADVHRDAARLARRERSTTGRSRCRGAAAPGYGNSIMSPCRPRPGSDRHPARRRVDRPQRSPTGRRSTAWRKVGRGWDGRRHLPVRPHGRREEIYSIDTPPPTVSGSLHIGHVFSLHPDRRRRPLPADARARRSSTRWAGTTTASRPSAGCRTTSASAATRPSPTTRSSSRRPAPPKDPVAISRPNFVELCERLTARTSRPSRSSGGRSGSRSTGRSTYATIDERSRRASPAGLPPPARGRRGLPARGADAVGRRLPHRGLPGRARGPRAPRRLPPPRASRGPTPTGRRDRDDPARAAPGVRRARRPPRRRPLPAAVRHRGRHAALRRPGAGPRPRARRPREGRPASRWSARSATRPT